jgi:hypothetical protein
LGRLRFHSLFNGHLTRRVDEALGKSKELRRAIETIESRLAGAHAAQPRQKKET